jgi:hypothetical protein
LADTGHALYGERWQSGLAADLGIADRSLRRWLNGEAPIPDNIWHEVRTLLIKRMDEIGGLVGYSVDPAECRIFHCRTAACFQYDETDHLTLLNPKMVAPSDVPMLAQGAQEALRQERERRQRGVFTAWADPKTGRIAPSTTTVPYKGCEISYPSVRTFSNKWTVNLASNDPRLFTKLGGAVVVDSFNSLEDAIAEAKRRVDGL